MEGLFLLAWPLVIYLSYKFIRLNLNQLDKIEKLERLEKEKEV
ncbi:hypothetical protein [Campylobacter sp. MIT 97-5078]|nr:hypothetical protein [Campylobacter sp. MIT 97-5078]